MNEILAGAKHINKDRYEPTEHAAIRYPGQTPGQRDRARALCGEEPVWVFSWSKPFDPTGASKCPKCVVKYMAQQQA
jgi:hypothetical protein